MAAVVMVAGCGGGPLLSGGAGGAGGAGTVAPAQAPLDGRCDLTPRRLVAASTYPVPQNNGPVRVGSWEIVVSGADLYYATYAVDAGSSSMRFLAGALLRVPVGGGSPTEIASGHVFDSFIVTDTSLIVERGNAWPNFDPDDIVSIPRAGGPPATLFTFGDNESPVAGPVTDGTFVYFSTNATVHAVPLASPADGILVSHDGPTGLQPLRGRLVLTYPEGDVKSVPLPPVANEGPVLIASGLPAGPSNVVTCGTSVCWLAEGANAIEKIDPFSGPATTVAALPASFGSVLAFAFDGKSFLVLGGAPTAGAKDQIAWVPGGGGPPTILLETRNAGAMAVDDECVYWSNADGIFSLAKTASGPIDQ
jgi:hypothetical protein